MKESDIRQVLAEVCQRLDERAVRWRAATRKAAPAVVGVSLGLVGACGGEVSDNGPVMPYGAPLPDSGDAKPDQEAAAGDAGPTVEYGGPPVDAGEEDAGALPPYMGVFPDASDEDAGAIPPYMGVIPDASEEDAGVLPPYMGAFDYGDE
jgi:hypothetical protein